MPRLSPLIHIPAKTQIHPLGSAIRPTTPPLLEFLNGLSVPSEGEEGFAVVGSGGGRRLVVEVSAWPGE